MFGIGKSKRMLQQLQEVTDRLTVLTKHVEELNRSDAQRAHVNIEKLEVDQAFLDQLVFRLESLDIEELSGSLNLGNNFSPKVENTPDADVNSGQNVSRQKPGHEPHQTSGAASNSPQSTDTFADGKKLKTTDTGYLLTL